MRKIIQSIITVLIYIFIIFSISGCADASEDTYFDTLDGLKTAAGDGLLYPNVLPDGFEPTYSLISGYYYKRVDAWDYFVSFRNKGLTMEVDNSEYIKKIAEGSPVVESIDARTFEPKHRVDNFNNPNRRIETDRYNQMAKNPEEPPWNIADVSVYHRGAYSLVSEAYDGGSLSCPAYALVSEYAMFMYGGVLYTVELRVFGHENESEQAMLELGGNMLKNIVGGMISGENGGAG